jgi:uncharacterized membrane protein
MPVDYNLIAGRNLDRIPAISDGIFAVAMTLLVLDLKTPARELVHSNADLMHTLAGMSPEFFTYFVSFLTLGIFWMGQQAQLNFVDSSDRNFTWIHLAFLLGISMLPFSTRLLSEFILYRGALLCYWLNFLYLGIVLYASWRYAVRRKLLSAEATHELSCAVERRLLIAQALYAGSAALCFFDTRMSIALILLLQLNYVFAPKLPLLRHI